VRAVVPTTFILHYSSTNIFLSLLLNTSLLIYTSTLFSQYSYLILPPTHTHPHTHTHTHTHKHTLTHTHTNTHTHTHIHIHAHSHTLTHTHTYIHTHTHKGGRRDHNRLRTGARCGLSGGPVRRAGTYYALYALCTVRTMHCTHYALAALCTVRTMYCTYYALYVLC
jgi:hypothetical protein